MLDFVLKFNSRVAFTTVPSISRDAKMPANVILAGSLSYASECSAIPCASILGRGNFSKCKMSFFVSCSASDAWRDAVTDTIPFQGIQPYYI